MVVSRSLSSRSSKRINKKKRREGGEEERKNLDCNAPMEKGHEEEGAGGGTKGTATLSDTINEEEGGRNNARGPYLAVPRYLGVGTRHLYSRVRFENSRILPFDPRQEEEEASFPRCHGSRK